MMDDIKTILNNEMDRLGIKDNELRAGIAAICGGESGFNPRTEDSYANTSNSRIRIIFGSRVRDLTDAELSVLKVDDEEFFNHVYGGEWGAKNLGNTQEGDGFKFRGRGPNQLTGRWNYIKYGRLSNHPEIIDNPDLVNDPKIGTAIAVAFLLDRYNGNGWESLKRANGNAVDDDVVKDRLRNKYLATGEFNYKANTNPIPKSNVKMRKLIETFRESCGMLQTELKKERYYNGEIDADWGPVSRMALKNWENDNP